MGRKRIGPRNRKITVAHPVHNPTFVLQLDLCHVKASNGPSSQYVVRGVVLVHMRIVENGAVGAATIASPNMDLSVKVDAVRAPFRLHCFSYSMSICASLYKLLAD